MKRFVVTFNDGEEYSYIADNFMINGGDLVLCDDCCEPCAAVASGEWVDVYEDGEVDD